MDNPTGKSSSSAIRVHDERSLDEETVLSLCDEIMSDDRNTVPSDRITLAWNDAMKMCDILREMGLGEDGGVCPYSDIFFADNVPLMDCEIELHTHDRRNADRQYVYRMSIYPDFFEKIKNAKQGEAIPVGFMRMADAYSQLCVQKGREYSPYLMTTDFFQKSGSGYTLISDEIAKEEGWDVDKFVDTITLLLVFWYGIQICLLHPAVKDIFLHPQRMPYEKAGDIHKGKNRRKRPVRYIRQHFINAEDISSRIWAKNDVQRKFNRKTMVWYQIGHWRTYKNGKTVFVHGCWKGPLRDTKSVDEPRPREIVTDLL